MTERNERKSNKILVTGANGFIGRYLVDALHRDGREVIAIGTSLEAEDYYRERGIRYDHVDIREEEDFSKIGPSDAVVHLAGLLSIDAEGWTPKDYFLTNALGTYNVMEYCRKNKVGAVVFSMTHSDMNKAKEVVITDSTPQQYGGIREKGSPLPYIISKIAGMNIINTYASECGIRQVIMRLPGIRGFGSQDTLHNCVFHQFIEKAERGEPIQIWGKHETKRDFVYVKDVVQAIEKALDDENARGTYNIGSGQGLTILDEAEAIIDVFSDPANRSKLVFRPDTFSTIPKRRGTSDTIRCSPTVAG
jgi:UDP-glucose 4-epimerase